MNPFDPLGSYLDARDQIAERQKNAAFERMIRCCRQALSVPGRLLALRVLLRRERGDQVCATC